MSESRKLRVIAVGAAFAAMVFTLVAVIVVLSRDNEPAPPSAKQVGSPVSDHTVRAADVVRLQRNELEVVYDQGNAKGVRVKDQALAAALGLDVADVILSISGKALTREFDAYDLVSKLASLNATTVYVELERKDQTALLLRWKVDGDLRQTRRDTTWSNSTLFGSNSSPPPGTTAVPIDDALLDTIEKIDDTHIKVPRQVIDAVLANPMGMARGVRIVPAMRNGQPEGIKLYAIRPTSLFARLGFVNGDTVNAINGFDLTTPDKALDIYTKLKDATSAEFALTRRGQPVTLHIEITK
jgi:type II secretory pathway component PulC